jgi:nucleolar complex protein 2
MGKKAGHKATKKFAKSGQLKKTIQTRHKQRNVKKRIERQKARAAAQEREVGDASDEEEIEGVNSENGSEVEEMQGGKGKKSKLSLKTSLVRATKSSSVCRTTGMSVDDILQGKFMEEEEEEVGSHKHEFRTY